MLIVLFLGNKSSKFLLLIYNKEPLYVGCMFAICQVPSEVKEDLKIDVQLKPGFRNDTCQSKSSNIYVIIFFYNIRIIILVNLYEKMYHAKRSEQNVTNANHSMLNNSNDLGSEKLLHKGSYIRKSINFSCPILDSFRYAYNKLFCWLNDDTNFTQQQSYKNKSTVDQSEERKFFPIHIFFVFIQNSRQSQRLFQIL